MRPNTACSLAFVATAVFIGAIQAQTPPPPQTGQQQQPPPSFRTRITSVPVDVRVLDSRGRPVTDLRREDFTILEDDVPQTIEQFSAIALAAEKPVEPGAEPPLRRAAAASAAMQNRRVFLVLLGRGRMTGPSKELEALGDFIRQRLLPQDYIAVLGYNRATDFSRDHPKVVEVIAQYRARHERIESLLNQHFSGLRAVYGAGEIPAHIQKEIDGVFAGAGRLRPREIQPGQISDAKVIAEDVRRTAAELERAELLADRSGVFAGLPDPAATATADRLDMSFDEYVERQSELLQDTNNLYAGIDYLRYLDGEKRLLYVTPRGLSLPRQENNRSIADAAGDARIAIDIIFTGGTVGASPPRLSPLTAGGRATPAMAPTASPAEVFGQTFMVQDLKYVAEITGGTTSFFEYTTKALSELDDATRFSYLLGYTPRNAAVDGRYRRVTVKVNRKDVTVLYRRGYFARTTMVPLDKRAFITETRMSRAGLYQGPITDIEVEMTAPRPAEGATELVVALRVRAPRIRFQESDGRRAATLDVAVYCGDGKEQIIGRLKQQINLNLTPDRYATFIAEGFGITARVPLTGSPAFVKAIVYDYGADLLGTATLKLR